MPTVPADSLELIARDLLMGAGATEHEAASVHLHTEETIDIGAAKHANRTSRQS